MGALLYTGSALTGQIHGRLRAEDVAELEANSDAREEIGGGAFILWQESANGERYAPVTIRPARRTTARKTTRNR